jgi:hypothetical protein
MGFKPTGSKANTSENTERKEYVPIVPEEGLDAVQIGLIVNLGQHKKQPKFAKDNAGKREQDKATGEDKIIWPKAGKDLEQRVAVYADLLNQNHDYGDDIGVKNIRLPIHPVSRGMSEGVNFTTVAPRDPDGNYIKGKPWSVPGSSVWAKVAAVVKMEDGTKVSDVMLKADYKNPNHNNIELLLGKPFMYNVEVKKTEKDGNTFVNTKLKSPVPLMKGMNPPAALVGAVSVNFDDEDLLDVKEELGGVAKFDLLRIADVRKIVLAEDYAGSKMQEAVQARFDEKELIAKAKEIAQKILENDKDLNEIKAKYPNGQPGVDGEAVAPVAQPKAPSKPVAVEDDFEDSPF